jgi:sulfur carrier protein
MVIVVNGERRELPDGETVTALLGRLGLDRAPCAVEVNRRVVPKAQQPDRHLADGDAVEVVTLVGGG